MAKKGTKLKQFCPRGHDTLLYGRTAKSGNCRACMSTVSCGIREAISRKKQFCLRGHDTFICGRTKKGMCRICERKAARKWAKNNPTKKREARRKWVKNNPRKIKEFHIRKTYNLTLLQISQMTKAQNFKCAICKKRKELQIDHDHLTKQVRGLLCKYCNWMLGLACDNTEILQQAIYYLKKKG